MKRRESAAGSHGVLPRWAAGSIASSKYVDEDLQMKEATTTAVASGDDCRRTAGTQKLEFWNWSGCLADKVIGVVAATCLAMPPA